MTGFLRSFLTFGKKHFLVLLIIPLLLLLLGSSYVRFIVQQDYLVSFEGDCDPSTESCYEGCEDDECTEIYYYSEIERHAAEVYALCGSDVSECDEAFECQEGVEVCSITFCDPAVEEEDTCVSIISEQL